MPVVHHGKQYPAILFFEVIIKDPFVFPEGLPHSSFDKVSFDGQADLPALDLNDYLSGEWLVSQCPSPVNPHRIDGEMLVPGE